MIRLPVAFLALALALGLALAPAAAQAPTITVVDGDTVRVGSEKIRLMGLDAPEMRCRCAYECRLARAATDRLRQLISRGYVTIDRRGRDKYGRTLAVIRVGGEPVAEVLIREGLARRYDGRAKRGEWC